MKYEVVTTAQAAADLRAIFEYIAYELLAGENAIKQLDRLEEAILSLDECRSVTTFTTKNRGENEICASCP